MYFKYADVLKAIENNDPTISNYFDTFGFVVIKNVLNKAEFRTMLKEYCSQYQLRQTDDQLPSIFRMICDRLGMYGKPKYGVRNIVKSLLPRSLASRLRGGDGMRFLPNFLDSSDVFTNFFLGGRFDNLYEYFAGKNWLYLGSDGSRFLTTSFPWHRDWFTRVPILKFNFYYNPLPFYGGRFRIIPGTNRPSDSYTQLVQKGMSWPMQNKTPGGMSENDFLPDTVNPRDIFSRQKNAVEVPHVSVNLGRGDLILFDHRSVHCVENSFPSTQRNLMTILISKNAHDFSDSHYSLDDANPDELMQELVDLIVNERNHIGCPPCGDAMLNSEFPKSNHFIEITKTGQTDRYDFGTFKLNDGQVKSYQLNFEHYEKIGREYRESFEGAEASSSDKFAQEFDYADVHMGINSQNIRKIENQ